VEAAGAVLAFMGVEMVWTSGVRLVGLTAVFSIVETCRCTGDSWLAADEGTLSFAVDEDAAADARCWLAFTKDGFAMEGELFGGGISTLAFTCFVRIRYKLLLRASELVGNVDD
jgi:hypothetical protein